MELLAGLSRPVARDKYDTEWFFGARALTGWGREPSKPIWSVFRGRTRKENRLADPRLRFKPLQKEQS